MPRLPVQGLATALGRLARKLEEKLDFVHCNMEIFC